MSELTNCKNCGAPVSVYSKVCPYCDTPYFKDIRNSVKFDESNIPHVPITEFMKLVSTKRRLERLEGFYNI